MKNERRKRWKTIRRYAMSNFYDELDDLDLDFDPDDPTDPLNALLEQIREDMEDTSPKAYVLNEKNMKRFMIAYKIVDPLVEDQHGKYLDIRTDPRECDFVISIEFPFLTLIDEQLTSFRKIVAVVDSIGLDPSSNDSIIMDIEVKNVYERIKLNS